MIATAVWALDFIVSVPSVLEAFLVHGPSRWKRLIGLGTSNHYPWHRLSPLAFFKQSYQLLNVPLVVREPSGHRWRHAQGLMLAAEVSVVGLLETR